jgi:hypothetical protein
MRPGSRRALTSAERALAQAVFAGALNLDEVRVYACPTPWPDRPFVPGRALGRSWVVYPAGQAREDFGGAALSPQATFIHELVHVWQAQRGVNLLFAKLRAGDSHASYAYRLGDAPFERLNIEQQAMVVEHAFRLARGGRAPYPAQAYAAVLPFTDGGTARV